MEDKTSSADEKEELRRSPLFSQEKCRLPLSCGHLTQEPLARGGWHQGPHGHHGNHGHHGLPQKWNLYLHQLASFRPFVDVCRPFIYFGSVIDTFYTGKRQ